MRLEQSRILRRHLSVGERRPQHGLLRLEGPLALLHLALGLDQLGLRHCRQWRWPSLLALLHLALGLVLLAPLLGLLCLLLRGGRGALLLELDEISFELPVLGDCHTR